MPRIMLAQFIQAYPKAFPPPRVLSSDISGDGLQKGTPKTKQEMWSTRTWFSFILICQV